MNLIICTTPFQMLMAEKIISLHPDEKFHLIVITHHDNKKYRFYYNRLSRCCEKFNYIKLLSSGKGKIFTICDLLYLRILSFFLPMYKSVFLANLENIWLQTLLSRFINSSDIYTYDDGTANIAEGSYLYKEENVGTLKNIVFRLIGKKVSLKLLKKKSKLHFTIYKSLRNIINETKHIVLYSDDEKTISSNCNQKEYRFFLGQPIYQFDLELYNKISQYINKFDIDYYFPHPREDIVHLKENYINIIKTELIFEDFLIEKLKQNNCKFKVYTLFSGSILNIANFPNVEVYAIKPKSIPEDISSIYEIFVNSGVTLIEEE
ncbi:hypothetical protein A6B40_07945 [Mannheimia varigena]|uniref:glycosyltransferase family 52 n=1 Tax=Mannheimia varigena TaxID=85404 RepID=UPI00159DC512|nr:glycosyltransferase family 52 [Mannheimia varigena]QLB17520.1 hypothetical protein A6B40_07945 [Mannheimia varigena]